MLTVRQILIIGWIILLMFVILNRSVASTPQVQGSSVNQAQAVEMYQSTK